MLSKKYTAFTFSLDKCIAPSSSFVTSIKLLIRRNSR